MRPRTAELQIAEMRGWVIADATFPLLSLSLNTHPIKNMKHFYPETVPRIFDKFVGRFMDEYGRVTGLLVCPNFGGVDPRSIPALSQVCEDWYLKWESVRPSPAGRGTVGLLFTSVMTEDEKQTLRNACRPLYKLRGSPRQALAHHQSTRRSGSLLARGPSRVR